LMLSEIFLTSESISELGNFYGVASVDMSPDEIWNTGSVWLIWCQMCQTDGVLLMPWAYDSTSSRHIPKKSTIYGQEGLSMQIGHKMNPPYDAL